MHNNMSYTQNQYLKVSVSRRFRSRQDLFKKAPMWSHLLSILLIERYTRKRPVTKLLSPTRLLSNHHHRQEKSIHCLDWRLGRSSPPLYIASSLHFWFSDDRRGYGYWFSSISHGKSLHDIRPWRKLRLWSGPSTPTFKCRYKPPDSGFLYSAILPSSKRKRRVRCVWYRVDDWFRGQGKQRVFIVRMPQYQARLPSPPKSLPEVVAMHSAPEDQFTKPRRKPVIIS